MTHLQINFKQYANICNISFAYEAPPRGGRGSFCTFCLEAREVDMLASELHECKISFQATSKPPNFE